MFLLVPASLRATKILPRGLVVLVVPANPVTKLLKVDPAAIKNSPPHRTFSKNGQHLRTTKLRPTNHPRGRKPLSLLLKERMTVVRMNLKAQTKRRNSSSPMMIWAVTIIT